MSLEHDITQIKLLLEAGDIFKAASPEQAAQRASLLPQTHFHQGREHSDRSNYGVSRKFARGDTRGSSLHMHISNPQPGITLMYSYGTPIALRQNGTVFVCNKRYPYSTSRQTTELKQAVGDHTLVEPAEFGRMLDEIGVYDRGWLRESESNKNIFKAASPEQVSARTYNIEEKARKLANDLHAKGYTDLVDASPEISLLEYGIMRNPSNNKVVFCVDPDGTPMFATTSIDFVDVKDALESVGRDFFSSFGVSEAAYYEWVRDPSHLSNVISDLNGYNSYFMDTPFNMSVDDVRKEMLSESTLYEAKPAKPKQDIFKAASPEQFAQRKEEYHKQIGAGAGDWANVAKAELALIEECELEFEDVDAYTGVNAVTVSGGGGEWVIFDDHDSAERVAKERVQNDLEEGIYGEEFMSNHIYISETDRRLIGQEEADNYVDEVLSDEDIIDEAELTDEYNEIQDQLDSLDSTSDQYDAQVEILEKHKEEILEEAKEKVRDSKSDEIEQALEDPIQYFVHDTGMYSLADLLKANFIQLDYDEAVDDIISGDGIGTTLASYDGNEIELPSGAYAYRTN